jgi:hypothetical protein
MFKRFGLIFFLVGFLIFSFSGTICSMGKMKAQQIAELLGNIAEEEDETSKEDGSDTEEALLELFDQVATYHIQLEQHYFPHAVDPLPISDRNTPVRPPEA